ncbi:thioredoxin family protein [Patescibacteria group bacterium]|nr:thioredoxin family protein [Patescibacteria group bacterium]
MKKLALISVFFVLFSGILLPRFSGAQEQNKVYISFFYGDGCAHCAKEELFLQKLENDYPNVEVKMFEVSRSRENVELMSEVADKLGINVTGVPLTIIGEEAISGYLNDATTGARIHNIVREHSVVGCVDLVGNIQNNGQAQGEAQCAPEDNDEMISLPIFGEVNPQKWSLPLLTIVIAAIDGFNPCAMWVLIFLISLLIGMRDRKKMWMLGSAFIIASGVVYFLFLAAWLNLFLFLGFVAAIRIGIGLVAIGSGGYHLKEWWSNRDGVCKVTDMERKQKIMDRFKQITSEQNFWLALGGIIVIAIVVNMIELVCSTGLPAIYTNVLAMADLPIVSYYLYLVLYIIIFMLDDMLIFVIAMTTLQITGLSTKYSRWSNLVGGVVIFVLGLLLIFKPGWVMFA